MTNKEFFIETWKSEMVPTLSAINGLPEDMSKLKYKCDEKARQADEILSHCLGHVEEMDNAVESFIADEKSATKNIQQQRRSRSLF